uniref:Predicted protein n=1 Tax=Hordeum vulgare subsp. vulgare TaxID=112509 RepID=F2E9I0_HORVV|nr:predicted protein [Hordeum vulgare subsp. vulgare]
MEESPACLFAPLVLEVQILCMDTFLMPPIPTVVVHSFLFLLDCTVALMKKR